MRYRTNRSRSVLVKDVEDGTVTLLGAVKPNIQQIRGRSCWLRRMTKETPGTVSQNSTALCSNKTMSTKAPRTKFKKASCAPKRFKSAFMFYSAKRHREIRDELASKSEKIRAADVAKLVSKSWKRLDTKDRAHWEEMARIDKERYEKEKALYKGPWKVPDVKYPDAPKKPMSAFLAFGNERRKAIATANPKMSNAEISSLLSKLWKECPPDVKQGYRDREKHERENFKKHRAEWELMKQREAGVDMPMITASGPLTGPTVSGSSNSFDPHVRNVEAFSGAASQSDDSDSWEEWMPGSDFDSDSDAVHANKAVQSGAKVNTAGIFPCSQPPCLPPIRSGSLVLPKLSTPQSLSIENCTLESFIDDEELFEDFSPQDAPTTAPFC